MFKAADKYDCPGLMKECVQTFRQTTNVSDIASLLQVISCKHVLLLIVQRVEVGRTVESWDASSSGCRGCMWICS